MKHTLSPWIAEPDEQAHCDNRHWIVGVSRKDGRRAHVAGDVVTHNVSLICAAPDMLDALKLIAESDSFMGGTFVAELQAIARAAIAKATGSAS
jgi:hypothetical protein